MIGVAELPRIDQRAGPLVESVQRDLPRGGDLATFRCRSSSSVRHLF